MNEDAPRSIEKAGALLTKLGDGEASDRMDYREEKSPEQTRSDEQSDSQRNSVQINPATLALDDGCAKHPSERNEQERNTIFAQENSERIPH